MRDWVYPTTDPRYGNSRRLGSCIFGSTAESLSTTDNHDEGKFSLANEW